MQRRVNRVQTEELVRKLRSRIDNLVMRTTFVVGFPGETDAQFAELKQFVEEAQFERMGVFPYSLEPDTPAAKLDGHLPEEVKNARRDEMMALQQQIAFDYGDTLVGSEIDVLIDDQVEEGLWRGRGYMDAPEIDGEVFVSGEDLQPGMFVPVEIVERRDYDLVGIAVSDESDE
jgi:ribosomal protein S12 methylthiotransferase